MAERYLIDTSGVIKYLNETFSLSGLAFMDEVVDSECLISFITQIELQVWNPPNANDIIVYRSFVTQSIILGISDEIIQKTIHIRRSYGLKLPDALIAATALINNFTLIADNDKDFATVPDLKYINPRKK